jgi:PsbN protein
VIRARVTDPRAGALYSFARPIIMDPSSTGSPALSVALAVLAVLLGLTGFGVYLAFGPPSKQLSDPFDDHDD